MNVKSKWLSPEVTHALKMLKRQPKEGIIKGVTSGLYFLLMALFLRAIRVCGLYLTSEIGQLSEEVSDVSTKAQTDLILLITGIKESLTILTVGLVAFGLLFFFISMRREYLLARPELSIKMMIGAWPKQVAKSFYFEQTLPFICCSVIGVLAANFSYCLFFLIAKDSFKLFLPLPTNFSLKVDLPILLIFSFILWRNYTVFKKRITRQL